MRKPREDLNPLFSTTAISTQDDKLDIDVMNTLIKNLKSQRERWYEDLYNSVVIGENPNLADNPSELAQIRRIMAQDNNQLFLQTAQKEPFPKSISFVTFTSNLGEQVGSQYGHYYLTNMILSDKDTIEYLEIIDSLHQEKKAQDYPELLAEKGLLSTFKLNTAPLFHKILLQEQGLNDCSRITLGNYVLNTLKDKSVGLNVNPSPNGQALIPSKYINNYTQEHKEDCIDFPEWVMAIFLQEAPQFKHEKPSVQISPAVAEASNEIILDCMEKNLICNPQHIQEYLEDHRVDLDKTIHLLKEEIQTRSRTPSPEPEKISADEKKFIVAIQNHFDIDEAEARVLYQENNDGQNVDDLIALFTGERRPPSITGA